MSFDPEDLKDLKDLKKLKDLKDLLATHNLDSAHLDELAEWLEEASEGAQAADERWQEDKERGIRSFDDVPERVTTWPKLSNKAGDDLVQQFGEAVVSLVGTPVCDPEEAEALKSVFYKLHLFVKANGRRAEKQGPGVAVAAFHLYWLWCRLAKPDAPASVARHSNGSEHVKNGTPLAFVADALALIGQGLKPRTLADLLGDLCPATLASGRVRAADMLAVIEGDGGGCPWELSDETITEIKTRLQAYRPAEAESMQRAEDTPEEAAIRKYCDQLEREPERKKRLADDFFREFLGRSR